MGAQRGRRLVQAEGLAFMPKHIPEFRHQNACVGQQLMDDWAHTLLSVQKRSRLSARCIALRGIKLEIVTVSDASWVGKTLMAQIIIYSLRENFAGRK